MFGNKINKAAKLAIIFIATLMLPVLILAYTEKNPFWVTITTILLPLGFYTMFAAVARRSGRMIWWGFIFVFFSAFQIVLSYLFGNSVIAADMFINLLTTNPNEASELLGNIYPSVIFVCVVYIPLLWAATVHLRKRVKLEDATRKNMVKAGSITLLAGCMTLIIGCHGNVKHVLRDEVFPVNVTYNLGLGISETVKVAEYGTTSKDFSFGAVRTAQSPSREIYVLVIGEAARADNWELFGYSRHTNPQLSRRNDLALFRNVTTQSNTTHKSVPMILSSIHTSQHNELYRRKGIPELFKEAGFTTYFISNQAPQGAMIDNLAADADHITYIGSPRYDMQMVDAVSEVLKTDKSDRILFILHSYGSHFSYHQRYPQEFATFTPDDDVAISRKNADKIRNAYDNSILYTDHVLNQLIELLGRQDACTAMLYCSDHGEDLFDDCEDRFLHSSPMVTYYQLHIASLAWFSPEYGQTFPAKVRAAQQNTFAPATTYSVFHTMADMASINSEYVDMSASLFNLDFDRKAERYYLDDHNNAVRLDRNIGIDAMQADIFIRHGIQLPQ